MKLLSCLSYERWEVTLFNKRIGETTLRRGQAVKDGRRKVVVLNLERDIAKYKTELSKTRDPEIKEIIAKKLSRAEESLTNTQSKILNIPLS